MDERDADESTIVDSSYQGAELLNPPLDCCSCPLQGLRELPYLSTWRVNSCDDHLSRTGPPRGSGWPDNGRGKALKSNSISGYKTMLFAASAHFRERMGTYEIYQQLRKRISGMPQLEALVLVDAEDSPRILGPRNTSRPARSPR